MTIPLVDEMAEFPNEELSTFRADALEYLAALVVFSQQINTWTTAVNAFGDSLGSLSNVILNGTVAPDSTLGQAGNYFLDTSSGDLYYRASDTWELKGNLLGPAGDPGLIYAADTGATDAYVMTPDPALAALDPARLYLFKAANANTGASTLNVSALGAKAIVDSAGAALSAGAIVAGQLVLVGYVSALDSYMLVGGGGSSGAASAGPWTDFGALPARTDDSTVSVADTADNQAVFVAGRPIRFRANSSTSWVYALVTAYNAGVVTIAGAPYTSTIGADSGREMHSGDMARLVQETVAFAGRFAAVATTQAIQDMLLLRYVWTRGAAHCVGFRVRPLVDDSGADQPHVNVSCNGALVGTANAGAGLAVSDAAWTATTTDISVANAAIGFGQPLEVVIDAAGTNDDARDLTVIVNLVLE
ncbi:hypothetical protein JCM15519_06800 [Fundidesulfovibrio butyratiphilus]